MSNSIKGLSVTFKTPVSEEYAEIVKTCILIMNHVDNVEICESTYEDNHTKICVNNEIRQKLYDFIEKELR